MFYWKLIVTNHMYRNKLQINKSKRIWPQVLPTFLTAVLWVFLVCISCCLDWENELCVWVCVRTCVRVHVCVCTLVVFQLYFSFFFFCFVGASVLFFSFFVALWPALCQNVQIDTEPLTLKKNCFEARQNVDLPNLRANICSQLSSSALWL